MARPPSAPCWVSAEKTGTDNLSSWSFSPIQPKTDKQEKLDRAADALRARLAKVPSCAPSCCTLTRKHRPKALGAAKARDKRKGEL